MLSTRLPHRHSQLNLPDDAAAVCGAKCLHVPPQSRGLGQAGPEYHQERRVARNPGIRLTDSIDGVPGALSGPALL